MVKSDFKKNVCNLSNLNHPQFELFQPKSSHEVIDCVTVVIRAKTLSVNFTEKKVKMLILGIDCQNA